jgi:uncharacterized protein involved in outer membrane biogenesis
MRTAVKIVAVAAGLVVVAAAGLTALVATLDTDALLAPVRSRVKEITGRELAIGGISARVSPVPKLVLREVSIANASWGSATPLAAAKTIEVQLALMPLLQRRVEVAELAINEPAIALETAADGRRNWEFDAKTTASGAAGAAQGTSLITAFAVGKMSIKDGTIVHRDGSRAVTTIAIDQLEAGARDADTPIGITLRGKVDTLPVAISGTIPALNAITRQAPYPINLEGEVAGRKGALRATVSTGDGRYRFSDLVVALGPAEFKGEFAITPGGARPKVDFTLAAGAVSLADLPIALPAAAPVKTASAPAPRPTAKLFSDEPISFAWLKTLDASGELAIERLTLSGQRRLDGLRLRMALNDAQLDVSQASASVFGGTANVRFTVDSRKPQPLVHLRFNGQGFDLAALLDVVGIHRDLKGGKTTVVAEIATNGVSPHQWASSAVGLVTAQVGPASLGKVASATDSPFVRLGEMVNPFHGIDATTELRCAVARLPLTNGVARADRMIGVETEKIGVSASGTIDLRNETLDLTMRPRAKAGVDVKVLQIASLVRVSGSLLAPSVGVDPRGSAETVARIGAAVATTGLSVLGETLISGMTAGSGECDAARGTSGSGSRAAADGKAASPKTANATPAQATEKAPRWWPFR